MEEGDIYHNDDCDRPKQSFDYEALDINTKIVVQKRTCEIKSLAQRTTQDIIEIGEKLIEVKEHLGYGNFGNWLSVEFGWGDRTARNFMKVAQVFKSANFADLIIASSALYLLAARTTPDSARQETLELARMGEAITFSKVKSLIKRHQELEKLQISTYNLTSNVKKNEASTTKSKSITNVSIGSSLRRLDEVSDESLLESHIIDVLAVVIDSDILTREEASAETSVSTDPISIRISDDCRALIKSVESLREEEAAALVRAIAKRWSVEKILDEIRK